ncbi:MAG: hypothetical protein IIB65_11915, partial [Proteobacteria bacterium]|nr:hypothetical protein [Pseudomonadota bacterium]
RDRPSGAELLAIARETLLGELLPHAPDAQRYNALMVAAARAIAGREAEAGDGALAAERDALAALYDQAGGADEPLDAALGRLNRRFAGDLRAGAFDAPDARQAAAWRLLRQVTMAKLMECNPKYLEAEG